jgi:site-specific recombinase XerC
MQPLDLEKLPDFAQSELQDFYQFLLQKYAAQTTPAETISTPLAPRLVKPFKPLSREAIYER